MREVFVPVILGIVILMIGISNMKGNISSIHSYHRKRVTEENIIPFGKAVGLGTVICGISLVIFGVFTFVAENAQISIFTVIGSVLLVVGLVVGLGLSFYAMIKYNKGIF